MKKFLDLPVSGLYSAKALAKQAAAARRGAGEIRRQLARIGQGLSRDEHKTLANAAALMERIADATRCSSQKRAAEEDARAQDLIRAVEIVTAAFADVIDPAGVVVMLATSGSWRTYKRVGRESLHIQPDQA